MAFVIGLSERTVRHRTGGPFGAAVFDRRNGDLLSVGVNLVVSASCSSAHAEVVALSLAQRELGRFDLAAGAVRCELVTSTEPCAMCLGACCWSGIGRVVCGARGEDAEAIGFDEGPKPADWPAALVQRHVGVVRDVLREKASAVLRGYIRADGPVYNPAR